MSGAFDPDLEGIRDRGLFYLLRSILMEFALPLDLLLERFDFDERETHLTGLYFFSR